MIIKQSTKPSNENETPNLKLNESRRSNLISVTTAAICCDQRDIEPNNKIKERDIESKPKA